MRLAGGACILVIGLGATAVHAQSIPGEISEDGGRTDVRSAVASSVRLASMQHALRAAVQGKTRAELGGPFFSDYRRSVRVPRQWADGDPGLINYIGHPVQGAASAFIWLDNDPSASRSFASSRGYWHSRLRAMAWAATYSLQFEIGPFSEAAIGNVGLRPDTVGWVDHVVTPTGGFLFTVGEDAIDRFLVAKMEKWGDSAVWRRALRTFLNPSRATANVAAGRPPWHRAHRPLRE